MDGSPHQAAMQVAAPPHYPASFPEVFVQYCRSNGIPPTVFQRIPWNELRSMRFIRVRTRTGISDELREIAQLVPWLPCNAYRIPRSLSLSSCAAYRSSDICCMDAASMASVVALQVRGGDRVLDLCCCPGMKLLLIADALREAAATTASTTPEGDDAHKGGGGKQRRSVRGQVVGVDVNVDRLLVARSIVKKYRCNDFVSLVCCDGRQYDPAHMANMACEQSMHPKDIDRRVRQMKKYFDRQMKRQRSGGGDEGGSPHLVLKSAYEAPSTPSATWMLFSEAEEALLSSNDRRGLMNGSGSKSTGVLPAAAADGCLLFDKILVDVECTHDGSVYHLDVNCSDEKSDDDAPPTREANSPSPAPPSMPENLCKRSDGVGSGGITNARRMQKMHVGKRDQSSDEYSTTAIETLHTLQLELLHRAFALLAPGGTIVYSTCSFSEGQNESIVLRFLNDVHKDATQLICVPEEPFGLQEENVQQEPHPPYAVPVAAEATDDDDVSPLLRLDNASVLSALRGVVDLTRRTWNIELGTSSGSRKLHSLPFVTARFWPNRSLTSFQFVAVLKKVAL